MATKIDLSQLQEVAGEFRKKYKLNKSQQKVTFYDYNKILAAFVENGEEAWMEVLLYQKEKGKNGYFFKRIKGVNDFELLVCFQLTRYTQNTSQGFFLSGMIFKGYINRCQEWTVKETIGVLNYPWVMNDEDKEPVKMGKNDWYIKIFARPVMGCELFKIL
uniref:Uncharacterized protein n=1 Tax=Marseillevirus LCMAC101 TaxID=2506602 RepID=A0A481YTB6_9VIRU|nr:MAG: hypothetical protein LCMAC101_07460 [Marseillevirus LCMAC101]